MIRTNKIPFVESKSSKELIVSTFVITIITIIIAFTDFATIFDLHKLPVGYLLWGLGLLIVYIILIQVYKKFYLARNKEWL